MLHSLFYAELDFQLQIRLFAKFILILLRNDIFHGRAGQHSRRQEGWGACVSTVQRGVCVCVWGSSWIGTPDNKVGRVGWLHELADLITRGPGWGSLFAKRILFLFDPQPWKAARQEPQDFQHGRAGRGGSLVCVCINTVSSPPADLRFVVVSSKMTFIWLSFPASV